MKINILGYGLMARQIAALLSLGGYNLYLWNYKKIDLGDMDRQLRLIQRATGLTQRGTITFVENIDDLDDNLTIESVIEDIEIKKNLYENLRGRITNSYCSNTSSYAPGEIGPDVYGLHFFNPVSMKFVEYYEAAPPNEELLQLIDFLRQLEFEVVPVHGNRGYLGNQILFHEISSALKLVEKLGYPVSSVNSFYRKLYDGRDIFNIIDLIGVDVVRAILINLAKVDSDIYVPECLLVAITNGVLGKKNKTSIKQVLP